MNIYKILLAVIFVGCGLVNINAQTCATAPIGLVSAFSGDNNALDARSRNNGTLQNGVTYAAGNVGQAFQLGGNGNASGSGDRVIVGNPANLRLQTFTVEAWVKRSSSAILTNSPVAGFVNGTIFAFGASGWGIVVDQPTNRLAFTQVGVNNIVSNLTIADTNWHHVAASVSGTQVVFYLDGVADSPINYAVNFAYTTSAAIGARGDSDARNAFFGAVDELAIYNRVLSASEIAAIFNAGTSGKCKPLATNAPDNQVLWLAGDGDALDSSGNGNNGTLQPGASYAVGRVGQGFQFNGSGGTISVPDNPGLSFGGNAPMTVEIWVYRTSTNAIQHFIGKRAGCTGNLDYQLARDVSAGFGIGFNRGSVAASTTAEDVPLNTWTHLAGTFDGTTSRLYKNGVQIASATGASGVANSAPLVIGNSGTCEPFGGSLDEPGVYNRALSAAEIESIANAGLAGKYKVQSTVPTGLAAWFTGDGNTNDISGNGNNGTLQGSLTYAVGKVGQGFQFDASASGAVSVADAPSLNPTAQISIEGWVYPTLDTIFPNMMAIIVNKETNAAVQFEMARRVSTGNCPSGGGIPTGNFAVYIAGLSGLPDDCGGWVNGNALLPLNTWSHVAMTYDGANLRAFVNGVNTRTVAATGAIPVTNGLLRLGKRLANTEAWVGQLDEMSVYDRALMAAEIRDQFYAGVLGKYKGAINPTVSNTTKTGEATVTFGTITTAGAVHLTPVNPALLPALPLGTNTGLNFDISTTAVYTNPTVCLNVSSLTPAQFANLKIYHLESGVWQNRTAGSNVYPNLCTSGLTSLSPFAIALIAPTAANVSISGNVVGGKSGLSNVLVTLSGGNLTRPMTARTNNFGFYKFDNLPVGETYVLTVSSKKYVFTDPTRTVNLLDEITDADFTAETP